MCVYVCTYVRTYVRMYVCLCVWVITKLLMAFSQAAFVMELQQVIQRHTGVVQAAWTIQRALAHYDW